MIIRVDNKPTYNLDYNNFNVCKPIFIPNIDKTITMFHIVGEDYGWYGSDQLLFHMRLEKVKRV